MCGNEVIKDRRVCDIFRIIWHSVVNIIWHTVPVWTSLPEEARRLAMERFRLLQPHLEWDEPLSNSVCY